MPVREEVQEQKLRTFSLGTGVPPTGPRAERPRSRGRTVGGRDRGIPPADADGVQAERDPDTPVGRRGPGYGEIRLRDGKTGARSVALSPAARKVLSALHQEPDNPWVIAGPGPGRHLANLNVPWLRVSRTHGSRRCSNSRPSALLRLQGASPRRDPDNDWKATRTPSGADHGSLRPPCARVREDIGRESRGDYRGRYGVKAPMGAGCLLCT